MDTSIRVEDKFVCVNHLHVRDGDFIAPGMKIAEWMTSAGVAETVYAQMFGYIELDERAEQIPHVSEVRVRPKAQPSRPTAMNRMNAFADNDNEVGLPVVFWRLAAFAATGQRMTSGMAVPAADNDAGMLDGAATPTKRIYYPQGKCVVHIRDSRDRNKAKSGATPHPSTSRSISNARLNGALLPCFG
jgi:hypothetical protein